MSERKAVMTGAERHELEREPIRISVAGPANEGKTSVLRTLGEDAEFGVVTAEPGSSRKVATLPVTVCGQHGIHVFDTPGFQMSAEITKRLDNPSGGGLLDEVLRVIPENEQDFAHDLAAWKQVAQSHMVFLVIDVTHCPAGRINDDLNLLSKCGRPTIVLLNFVPENHQDSKAMENLERWKKELAGYGFFQVTEFDAHRRNFENQLELLTRARLALDRPSYRKAIQTWIDECKEGEDVRLCSAVGGIASLVLDLALFRKMKASVPPEQVENRRTQIEV